MKSVKLFSVLIGFVCLVAVCQTATDYCAKELCGNAKHVACNATGDFAAPPTCSADRKLGNMTSEIITAILQKMNGLRNTLASGNLTNFQPCPKMATMTWDAELSKLAEYNSQTCLHAHDACHNTKTCPQSGQNIAMAMSSAPHTASPLTIILGLIDLWWNEYKVTTMSYINQYPEIPANGTIGHFTEMAREDNSKCGCSFATFQKDSYDFYLVCNFETINILNGQTYSSGKSASQCTKGPNPIYKSLCA